ncbi:hypothetical protein GCM10023085_25030 [Actinomadura viridis]|uniref:Uncharacterized protein n=1 Tax=Actinomadura viridis TaxID=58110 RepID=A0A931DHU2_9ACTN|nr:hypothetical protein [Actinomadura viridis]MBG6088873.1 hypothetical protein [Actinomadura viridis]
MPGTRHLAWLEAADRRRYLARRRGVRTGQAAPPLLSGITAGGNVRATALTERYVAMTVKDAAAPSDRTATSATAAPADITAEQCKEDGGVPLP